ncbi:MAG: hypothetical protein JNK66_11545, partial [Chitinophagales bacterium]|nr:hypothetical protein [Chitinophagales bacterium]
TNTTSLLYNLTTNSGHNISQFTPPASLLHNDGLNNNDGELCLYFNIHPQCNDTIIPALKVTFSYVRYCQLSTSLSDSVTIPLRKIAVTAAGAFDGCVTLPMLTLTESCALYPTLSVAPTGLVNYAWAVPTGQSAPCPNSQSCTVTSINPQVQGTYIVTVTYSTAPLCTRTTQLAANTSSVGIAVGSGVGLPTVSSAMAAGALLPPATAATTPQHIRLLGTLTVDTNYTFKATTTDSSTIYCMGGAEIIVNSGRTLTLSGNTTTRRVILQGCDTLWRGINVADSNLTTGLAGGQIISNYATIRDAQYGLHLHHGSRLSVKRTNFTHCFVGIFFNPDSLPTGTIPIVYYTPGQFLGNSFDGLSPLFKIPYNGMVNATGQPVTDTVRVVMRPWAGMHLKNLAEFTMGGGVPNTVDRNHFDHLENGVIITNGDLTVFNARFYRMGRGFVSPTLPPTNSGIRYQYASHLDGCAIRATSTDTISGGYPAHSLFIRGGDTLKLTATTYTIIPDTVNWFILSANWGVYSSNMNVNIGGCRIAGDLLRGIEVRNAPLAVIKIGKVRNKIEPRDKGIFLLNNDPTLHTEVSYNTIIPGSGNADNSPDSSYITRIAIEVQEQNNTPVGNLWIHHNDIHLNTYGTDGIILNGCKGGSTGFVPTTQVFNNSINLLSVARRRTGITATNCDSVMIKLNDVFSNPANLAPTASSNAIPTNTYPIGYDFAFTTNLFVECNRTNGLYTGMRFRGPNLFAQVRGNEFGTSAGGSTFGHRYGLRVANTATINAQAHRGNRWLGSYTSGFAAENLNVLQYTNMMFNVDSNASPIYWPTSTGLSSTFPTNGWFFNTSGSSYQCYSTNYGSSGKNNQEDEETALDTISQVIINDELSFEQYETPLIWQNEQAVYQKLQGNESLRKPGTPAASFYEAKLTSLMGEITVAEQHRQTAVQPSTDVAHALLQLQWHKDSLNEAITTLFEANGNIAAIAALTQHKAIATQQISEILPLHRTATQISVNAAKATNNNLQVSEQIENNLRLINNIYLNTVAANIDTFSSAQLDTLYYVALQCPLAGGVAVHRARGLLCGVIDTIYDDNQLCSEDGYSYKKERNLSTSKQSTHSNLQFTLMPNPAKESIALICSQQLNHLIRLSVCDFTGRIMFDELIQFNDKRFLLRLNDFITGLYLLRATDNNGLSYTSTFNVIR